MNSVSQTVDAEEIEETAYYIAGHLGETQKLPQKQIRRIVTVLGPEQALAYLKKTQEVEKQGGMLIQSGKRRRTPGGTFFNLIQTQCDEYTLALIWPNRKPGHE